MNFLTRMKARRDARKALRRLPEGRRAEVLSLTAEACNTCKREDEIETFVVERCSQLTASGAPSFGIAEILIIIQIVMLLYKIAQYMGWLKTATPAMIAKEIGE